MPLRLKSSKVDFAAEFSSFLSITRKVQNSVEVDVSNILEDVRVRGDEALFEYTTRFDRFLLTAKNIRISPQEIKKAHDTNMKHI